MPFNCIVVIREVWDTRDLSGDVLDGGKLKEAALTTRFEPEDLNALEMALQIKDKQGGKVTALTIGASRAVDVLKEALYRGVDEVIRITGVAPGEADTATAAALVAGACKKIGAYDLVLTGVSVADGEPSLLGGQIAGLLGIEQITWVDALDDIQPGKVTARRSLELGRESIEAKLPAVLAVGVALLKDDPRSPRSAKATLKLKHKKTEAPAWAAADLGVSPAATCTVVLQKLEAIPQRAIESKDVAADDESALKAMLAEITKGA